MGKLFFFLILGFMAYAVLKQLLVVVRFFEPKPQQQRNQKKSREPETGGVVTPEAESVKEEGGRDWVEEIKRAYDLFNAGALTKEEFEQVKAQFLARVGTES